MKTNVLLLLSGLCISAMLFACSSSDGTPAEPDVLLINEFKSNIPEDEHALQYIELKGTPDTTIQDTVLLVIDGDEDDQGKVDYALSLDEVAIGENGLIIIKNADQYNDQVPAATKIINEPLIRTYDEDVDGEAWKDGLLEHDAVTYMLVKTTSAFSRGDDLDDDDDGTLELPEDAQILDAVGNQDGGDGVVYTQVVLTQSASDPDAATRFQGNLNAETLDAWANGDIYEDPLKSDDELPYELLYDTLEASSNLPPRAKLTPGAPNFEQAPFVLLNEVVNSGDKYVEILSNPSQSLTGMYLVLLGDENGTVAQSIDLGEQSAQSAGLTMVADTGYTITPGSALTFLNADLSALTSGNMSVMLIYSPQDAIETGDDLDTDDDGSVDLPDAAIITDNIGWNGSTYADVVIDETYEIQGVSRYKDNRMAALSALTYGELSGVDYTADSKGEPEDAMVTPGSMNVTQETAMLVMPDIETERSTLSSPDADDIAFWIHPTDASQSLIIATQKNAGYSIYDVDGKTLLDGLPGDNRYNNVDVMYDFSLNGETIDIAVFSDRNNNKFAIWKIQATTPYIVDITDYTSDELFDAEELGEDTAYGEGVYKSPVSGKFYAFATQNDTWNVAQFELVANGDTIGWTKVRDITLEADDDDKHAEGIVVDQEYGKAYIAQEEVGVYIMDAEPGDTPADLALTEDDLLIEEGDNGMVEDLEGMTIYYKDDGEGYVFLSSQGNSSYGVFDRTDTATENSFLTSFAIVHNMEDVDGSQHTDSMDVTNIGLSDVFPNGVFIVQDGTDSETDPDDVGTNFKWVAWEKIAAGLDDVTFTSSYDPRNPTNRR